MKKYRLKNEYLESVYIGKYPNSKRVVVLENLKGNKDECRSIALGRFTSFLWRLDFKILHKIEEVVEYSYNNLSEWTPEQLVRVIQESNLDWPIELGLVEEIPEEPKREYKDENSHNSETCEDCKRIIEANKTMEENFKKLIKEASK